GVPPDADTLAQQSERHGIEGPAHFDVPIGVDRALAAGEDRKGLAGKRVERPLLDLDKVRPDLAPRGAVNAQPRDRAIPVPQKRLELLIPDRFLVAVPRMAQRHPKHPGPSPLARGGVERGRAAEEIYLCLGPGRTVKDADGAASWRDRPHKPFHRFVARAVP